MSSSAARRARAKVAKEEGLANFTTCIKERPLDLIVRRLQRRLGNATRTRKAKKQ